MESGNFDKFQIDGGTPEVKQAVANIATSVAQLIQAHFGGPEELIHTDLGRDLHTERAAFGVSLTWPSLHLKLKLYVAGHSEQILEVIPEPRSPKKAN